MSLLCLLSLNLIKNFLISKQIRPKNFGLSLGVISFIFDTLIISLLSLVIYFNEEGWGDANRITALIVYFVVFLSFVKLSFNLDRTVLNRKQGSDVAVEFLLPFLSISLKSLYAIPSLIGAMTLGSLASVIVPLLVAPIHATLTYKKVSAL